MEQSKIDEKTFRQLLMGIIMSYEKETWEKDNCIRIRKIAEDIIELGIKHDIFKF